MVWRALGRAHGAAPGAPPRTVLGGAEALPLDGLDADERVVLVEVLGEALGHSEQPDRQPKPDAAEAEGARDERVPVAVQERGGQLAQQRDRAALGCCGLRPLGLALRAGAVGLGVRVGVHARAAL